MQRAKVGFGGPGTGTSGRSAASRALSRVARALGAVSLTALGLFLSTALGSGAELAQAAPCDPPIQNAIVCENSKPGNPQSEWDVSGGGDPNIQGFATDISVNHGQTVHFKIDTAYSAYHLDIYRMGYYGGDGARKVATVTPSASLPQKQPACLDDPTTGLTDCGNWAESASWAVPADAVSGIYFAKLVRDGGASDGSHIFFIVRDDASHSNLLFQTQDTTWEAYNQYGGRSLYQSNDGGPGTNPARAYKVSYNRPLTSAVRSPRTLRSTPSTRWSAGWSETATTSPTSPGWTAPGSGARSSITRPSSRSATTSTGLAPSATTSRRPGPPASTSPSSRATRASGRPAGSPAPPTARPPTGEPSSVTRRPTPTPRSTRARATPGLDGDVARSPLQPAGRRRSSGERGHGHDVQGQLRHLRDRRAGGRRQDAHLAQHQHRVASPGPDRHPGRRHPRVRVGRGARQRLPSSGAGAAFIDHEERRPDPSGLRLHVRHRHGDPPHDPVQGPERRARLRRRHDPVVLGTRRKSRSRRLDPRPAHAAGDGQRARRHGRPARHAAGRPGRGYRLDRHGSPQLRDQLAA